MISREYGCRSAAVTHPVEMHAGQKSQPFRAAAVTRLVESRREFASRFFNFEFLCFTFFGLNTTQIILSGPVTYCNLGIGLKMFMCKIIATVL